MRKKWKEWNIQMRRNFLSACVYAKHKINLTLPYLERKLRS